MSDYLQLSVLAALLAAHNVYMVWRAARNGDHGWATGFGFLAAVMGGWAGYLFAASLRAA